MRRYAIPLLLAALAGPAAAVLLQPFYFASGDGPFHLLRLVEYQSLWSQGIPYPRWAPDFYFGYGYPLFNYYAPLTYFAALPFLLLRADPVLALKAVVLLSLGLCTVGAYLYARLYLSRAASAVVAAAFTYAPYHLATLYYRGDLAEGLAMAWYPLILWSVTRVVESRRPRHALCLVVALSGLVLTHNLSALLFAPVLVLYALMKLILGRQPTEQSDRAWLQSAGMLAVSGLTAVGLTAFFWLPAVAEEPLISMHRLVEKIDYHTSFLSLSDLLSRSLAQPYGSVFNAEEALNHQLALWQIAFLALGIAALVWRWKALRGPLRSTACFHVVATLFLLFMITPASAVLWEKLPLLPLTQFPWRFLGLVALPVAFLGGLAVDALVAQWRSAGSVAVGAAVVLASVLLLRPPQVTVDTQRLGVDDLLRFELSYGAIGTSIAAEYLPSSVSMPPVSSPLALSQVLGDEKPVVRSSSNPSATIARLSRSGYSSSYSISTPAETTLTLNQLDFPGWDAQLDGRPVAIGRDQREGLIQVPVPPGQHVLVVRYAETPLRLAADLLSAAVAVGLGVCLLIFALRPRRAKDTEDRRGAVDHVSGGRGAKDVYARRDARAILACAVVAFVATVVLAAMQSRAYASVLDPAAVPASIEFPSATLLGYALESPGAATGRLVSLQGDDPISLRLYWRPNGKMPEDARSFVRLTSRDQQTWAYAESAMPKPAAAGSADVEQNITLRPDGSTPPGVYHIEVGMLSGATPIPLRRANVVELLPTAQAAQIGPLVLAGRQESQNMATPTGAIVADLDRLLLLTQAAVRPARAPWEMETRSGSTVEIQAGQSLFADLRWITRRRLPDDYTLTLRLVDDLGLLWGIKDIGPSARNYPMSLWLPDSQVADKIELSVPDDTPPGLYRLQLEVMGPDRPLSVIGSGGNPEGPTVALGQVKIDPSNLARAGRSGQGGQGSNASADLVFTEHHLGSAEASPGETLHVDVRLLVQHGVARDLDLRLTLESANRDTLSDETFPLFAQYPAPEWRAGEKLRGQFLLRVPARVPPGVATVRAIVVAHDTGDVVADEIVGTVQIKDRPRQFQASPHVARGDELGSQIRLLGYDAADTTVGAGSGGDAPGTTSVKPGAALSVTLYWQAMKEIDTSYKIFVQLLSPQGRLVAQHDSPPQNGSLPTSGWQKGEVVADTHSLHVPDDLDSGTYSLIVGAYDPAGGERLKLPNGSDFVRLLQVDVPGGPN